MKIAIVHDYLIQYGGAERVVEVLHDLYPDAPIFCTVYNPKSVPDTFQKMDIRTSFLQRWPFVKKHFRAFMPVYPFAVESLDLSGYDVVLSSSSAFAKAVITPPDTLHICYCHNPARFLYDFDTYAKREKLRIGIKAVLPIVLSYVRLWDVATAARVDYFIANSRLVAQRITDFYRRDSIVINPPADVLHLPFNPAPPSESDYYLTVGRLVPYKRVDVAIRAFITLGAGYKLKIVGSGRDEAELRTLAAGHPNIEFVGQVDDAERNRLLAGCRAFVTTELADFGIAPLEAMACGRAVLAYGGGGSLETVVDGQTGLFFDKQAPDSLADVVRRYEALLAADPSRFNPDLIRRHAESYDTSVFKERVAAYVAGRYAERHPTTQPVSAAV